MIGAAERFDSSYGSFSLIRMSALLVIFTSDATPRGRSAGGRAGGGSSRRSRPARRRSTRELLLRGLWMTRPYLYPLTQVIPIQCLPAKVRRMLPDEGLCSWSRGSRRAPQCTCSTNASKEPLNHFSTTPQSQSVPAFFTNHACQDLPPMVSGSGPHLLSQEPSAGTVHFHLSEDDTCPSAPSPGLVYFDSDEESDVVFKGVKPYIWRIPSHSFIWEEASPVLKEQFRMIISSQPPTTSSESAFPAHQVNSSSFPASRFPCCDMDSHGSRHQIWEIEITDVRAEVFYKMLQYIYTKQSPVLSVPESLDTLDAARRYKIPGLISCCLHFLKQNVTKDTVLKVLQQIRPHEGESVYNEPSDNQQNELFEKCLDIVDRYVEELSQTDEFKLLDNDLLDTILSRDTAKVSSEMIGYEILISWATFQCRSKHKEPSNENMREVLGKALFSVRYLLMDKDELMRGPLAGGLLTDDEKNAIKERIEGKSCTALPAHMANRKLDVKRRPPADADSDFNSSASGQQSSRNCGNGESELDGTKSPHRCRKKNSPWRKAVNRVGNAVIFIIQLLD